MNTITHGGDIYSFEEGAVLDFSININPLGMPAGVKKALVEHIESYSHYPDPLCRALRSAISAAEGMPQDCIVCGNGAADLIFRICLAFKPKKGLLLSPTFSEYEAALRQVGSEVLYHSLLEGEGFVLSEKVLQDVDESVDILFLCNPNNPTGIPIEKKLLLQIAEKCKVTETLLVVDECFMDFLNDPQEYSLVGELENRGNVILLKAFTKTYAMAGIRLGYCLCGNAVLASQIAGIGQPWSVSTVAAKCGEAALQERAYVQQARALIQTNRQFLAKALKDLGMTVFPSQANYLLFKAQDPLLAEKLRAYGILIRSCGNFHGLNAHFYRINVKNYEENVHLIKYVNQCMEV